MGAHLVLLKHELARVVVLASVATEPASYKLKVKRVFKSGLLNLSGCMTFLLNKKLIEAILFVMISLFILDH